MLDPGAQEHRRPVSCLCPQDGHLVGQVLLAYEPTRLQDVCVGVAGHHLVPVVFAAGQYLVGGAAPEEGEGVLLHAVGRGVVGVDAYVQSAAGAVELLGLEVFQRVGCLEAEDIYGVLPCLAEADQGAALFDPLLELLLAFVAEP